MQSAKEETKVTTKLPTLCKLKQTERPATATKFIKTLHCAPKITNSNSGNTSSNSNSGNTGSNSNNNKKSNELAHCELICLGDLVKISSLPSPEQTNAGKGRDSKKERRKAEKERKKEAARLGQCPLMTRQNPINTPDK